MLVKTLFYNQASRESDGAAFRCNKYLEDVIVETGHDLQSFYPELSTLKSQAFIPWDRVQFKRSFTAQIGDIALYCDRGVLYSPPSPRSAKVNIVLLHGLYYNFELINSLEYIDLILTTSPYWAEVAKMMLGGKIITTLLQLNESFSSSNKSKDAMIYHLKPPIEIARHESIDNKEFFGRYQNNLLAEHVILAHSIQPGKASVPAFVGIIALLASHLKESNKVLKIFTSRIDRDAILAELQSFKSLKWIDELNNICADEIKKCLIFTDRLPQSELHHLFSLAKFGLCYNDVPESFGMYVLESILSGCPVFSNGSGNMRHLLPPSHGHYIHESNGIYERNQTDLKRAVKRIILKLDDPNLKQEIDRGRLYITNNYNKRRYKKEFKDILMAASDNSLVFKKTNAFRTSAPQFQTIYKVSPLVRTLCQEGHYIIADHETFTLSEHEFKLLMAIEHSSSHSSEYYNSNLLQSLLNKGLICLK